jgi:quercetin dioxygenase-like cupin family protein
MRRSLFLTCLLAASTASALENNGAVTVTPLMKTSTSWDGKPLVYPAGQAEVSALIVEIAPGGETGWHQHPVPSFGVVLEGTLEVRLEDGRTRRIERGEALAEVVSTLHNGRNVGDAPLKLLVFYAGSSGTPLTIKAEATKKP